MRSAAITFWTPFFCHHNFQRNSSLDLIEDIILAFPLPWFAEGVSGLNIFYENIE